MNDDTMTTAKLILVGLGWRIRSEREFIEVLKDYQRGNAIGVALKVDGILGPLTMSALKRADERRHQGKGTASANFSFDEFRCKCGGKYLSCRRIWIKRSVLIELQRYRIANGDSPIKIVSGCRCPGHNRDVGGVSKSRHMKGDAVDFAAVRSLTWFKAHGLFRGRGFNGSDGKVRHGDMRLIPTSWRYS